MKLRIGPNQIINIPVYFTPKITSETKIKTLEIYVYGFRNQQGKPVKSKIRLEGTVSQSSQCVANHITKYKMGLTNDSQSQNSTLDTAFCKKSPPCVANRIGKNKMDLANDLLFHYEGSLE